MLLLTIMPMGIQTTDTSKPMQIWLSSSHDIYVQVTVADTGCGIAAEDLGKVKEKFYKANTNVQGSGIGLAVADEIVKQHNGILEVDSKQGEGTTVSIILPFITNNEQTIEEGTEEIE